MVKDEEAEKRLAFNFSTANTRSFQGIFLPQEVIDADTVETIVIVVRREIVPFDEDFPEGIGDASQRFRLLLGNGFKKVLITKVSGTGIYDEDGILHLNFFRFLKDRDSLKDR